MRILFVGDVVGSSGRKILKRALPELRREHRPELVVVNAENSAGGAGVTPATADELLAAGANVLTSGNHIWDRREIRPYLDQGDRLLRPANYPDPAPGVGVCIGQAEDGSPVAVVNLIGRVFMGNFDDPFRTMDEILDELDDRARMILVDFHAEATSEKVAMGWYLDGRVSAVIGTHTHVATADECVLPGGTAYITDVGMTGPHDSIIGVPKEQVLERFLTQRPVRFNAADSDPRLSAVLIEVSPQDGKARSIRRLVYREENDATAC